MSGVSENANDGGWEDWCGDEEDDQGTETKSLFCDKRFPTPQACLEFDESTFGFSLHKVMKILGIEFYDAVQLVNYIRFMTFSSTDVITKQKFDTAGALEEFMKQRKAGCLATDSLIEQFSKSLPSSDWKHDKFFRPFIQDDPLVMFGLQEPDDVSEEMEKTDDLCKLQQQMNDLKEQILEKTGVSVDELTDELY
mmetsp:Transcript_16927/g.43215  ORF Transcript_16927/g.43215 Transcript_16927/m.43215 type:complete len:195 (-) Transcript_16927:99-683(-)|eukprot:CAMPEP_0177634946 /NCGR_PEP_ID=MMETSP0447-20121125/3638_1 /TAXON_ID=0 /ORGANISM="Stygamoeba regulata, Strain BSH-02190019" /LENGTH=194 /DNA_ID=CAMNT_0019136699 /DNA_START=27 /DNA_END=611 /DNA_ORIENTATION=-